MRFRKRPVVIDAFRWTGDLNQAEDPDWAVEAIVRGLIAFENSGTPDVAIVITTSEGRMRANRGDWIIRGIKGEFYPCKPDVFEATYERVP